MHFILPTALLAGLTLAAPAPIPITNATTTALLAGLTLAAAAPIPVTIAPNTATCQLEYAIMKGTWTVQIGRPYINGAGCASVKKALKKGGLSISSNPKFKCEDDGTGNTRLEFTTVRSTKKQNSALQDAYPMIPFVQNSICDPYLV